MTSKPAPASTIINVPLIISVLGAGLVSGLVPAGLLPASLLNIEREYGLSHEDMGRIVGLCMIFGGGTGGLLGGWVCSRIGALKNLLISTVMTAAALGTIAAIPNIKATVGGLAGYFFAAGFMGSSNALAVYMLPDRQRGVTLLHSANSVGKVAGPLLAAALAFGVWRLSYFAAALMPLALVVPVLLARRGGDMSVGRKGDDRGRPGAFFWICILGFGAIAGSEIAVALWLPAYASEVHGFSPVRSKALLSIFLMGLVTGRLVTSAFPQYLAPRRSIAICSACVVFSIPAAMLSGYWTMALFYFLFGLAFSATWPSYFAHLSHIFSDHLGLMSGAAVFATQIGFAACSWASGRLADINLCYPIFFGAAVMAIFALLFFASRASHEPKGVDP